MDKFEQRLGFAKPTVAAPRPSPYTRHQEKMTDNPHPSAYGTGIAQAYGEGATATVNITGLNPEQIAALLQAAGAAAQAKIDELAPI